MRVPLNQLLFALSHSLDFVENELLGSTTNHGKRTAYIAMRLARGMGLGEPAVFDIASCAVLHDNALTSYMLEAGPGHIGRLERISIHCEKGEENAGAFPFLEDVSGAILHHHENWDGTGYHHLAGRDIPLRAAMIRLADGVDVALRLGTVAPDREDAIRGHLSQHRSTWYSPELTDTLLDILNDGFSRDLTDECIDGALASTMPAIRMDLSTEQLLKICAIFSLIIDAKSPFTRTHSQGIARKTAFMGKVFGLDDEHCAKLAVAASLHDVGKLSTPLSILEKPGPLTPEEMEIMRQHAAISWRILQPVRGLEEVTWWAGNHHEKLNGTGYPFGYKADQLGFECRLLAACDIYQALIEDRPYRSGLGHAKAVAILTDMADKGEVDADIVKALDSVLQTGQMKNATPTYEEICSWNPGGKGNSAS
jgi:HD-GYP domain-containing protein (c-di-GMP phosphodiesterase class II)